MDVCWSKQASKKNRVHLILCVRTERADSVHPFDSGLIEQRLVKIDRPILRIPNLAIHLQTAEERDAFKVNKEDHLSPILAMAAEKVSAVEHRVAIIRKRQFLISFHT